jgi:hypothetical protein
MGGMNSTMIYCKNFINVTMYPWYNNKKDGFLLRWFFWKQKKIGLISIFSRKVVRIFWDHCLQTLRLLPFKIVFSLYIILVLSKSPQSFIIKESSFISGRIPEEALLVQIIKAQIQRLLIKLLIQRASVAICA